MKNHWLYGGWLEQKYMLLLHIPESSWLVCCRMSPKTITRTGDVLFANGPASGCFSPSVTAHVQGAGELPAREKIKEDLNVFKRNK